MEQARKGKKRRGVLGSLVRLLIIATFVIYATGSIINLRGHIAERGAETEALQAQVASQRLRNAALLEDIESDDIETRYVRAARNRLGMVKPGEIIIVDMTP